MNQYLRQNIGWIFILVLIFLPVWRWFLIVPLSSRVASFVITMLSFGQIAGLAGVTLFSINLILSSRLKFIDNLLYGLSNSYNLHHKIGVFAFSLLLFHPLFLSVRYISISLKAAALFFIPQGFEPITYGIIALSLMIVLLSITFYLTKLKYNHWKLTHKFMVLVFVFAFLHILLIPSDISRDSLLRIYILSFAILGLALGFYRAFLSKYINRNLKYKVKSVVMLNKNVIEIELEPEGKVMDFLPGQFVFVIFFGDKISRESHPFSISSPPDKNNLKLVIKSLGDFTENLRNVKAGGVVSIDGPFGRFSYRNFENKNQIWLAGGIGITPFLSMARSLSESNYKIDLYYCTSNRSEAVLLDELSVINSNIKVMPWYSEEKGFITAESVFNLSGGLEGKDILLCGPVQFMKGLERQFLKLGVKNKNIHFELFNLL